MKTNTARLMVLALKGLESERERIDEEIKEIQAQMKDSTRGTRARGSQAKKAKRRISISPEESRRRSERMKNYWAEFRKGKGKAKRKSAKPRTKSRTRSAPKPKND